MSFKKCVVIFYLLRNFFLEFKSHLASLIVCYATTLDKIWFTNKLDETTNKQTFPLYNIRKIKLFLIDAHFALQ